MTIKKLPLILLATLFSPCLPAQTTEESLGAALRASAGSTEVDGDLRDSYILRPDDQVQLNVYGESELSVTSSIGRDGKATFPLIDTVSLKGLTLDEAKEKIWALYEADYLVNPNLGLTVAKYAQQFVTVTGQVVDSGAVPIPDHGKLSLFTALTNAGGLTGFADDERIQLFSTRGDTRNFTLEQIRGEIGKATFLHPGDQIVVPKNRHANSVVSVQGEVSRPGTINIHKSGRLELSTALTTVGGLGPEADPLKIKLIQADGTTISYYTYKEIKEGPAGQIRLKGGERIIVPQSPFVGESVLVEGEVGNRGLVPFPMDGKLTLKEAIIKAGGFGELANRKVILKRQGFEAKTYDLDDLGKDDLVIPLRPDDSITAKRRIF